MRRSASSTGSVPRQKSAITQSADIPPRLSLERVVGGGNVIRVASGSVNDERDRRKLPPWYCSDFLQPASLERIGSMSGGTSFERSANR